MQIVPVMKSGCQIKRFRKALYIHHIYPVDDPFIFKKRNETNVDAEQLGSSFIW